MLTFSLPRLILPEKGGDEERQEGDDDEVEEDVLDRQKCQAALAALRHAKWFQVSAAGSPSLYFQAAGLKCVSENYLCVLSCAAANMV